MPKPDKQNGLFAPLTRNICNYPIARDARLKLQWRQSEKTGRWLCHLPEDDAIQFKLPPDTPKRQRRWPTAFDVNLLLLLLCEAKRQSTAYLEFRSYSALLKALGYSCEPRNRDKVKAALSLWSALSIRFAKWRVPPEYVFVRGNREFSEYQSGTSKKLKHQARYETRVLPPPIAEKSEQRGSIQITISKEWRGLAKRYYQRVPLPLPREAAAQNLALAVLTSLRDDMPYGHGDRSVRNLCRKIGLSAHNSAHKLRKAIEAVKDWFAEHGGVLVVDWPRGGSTVMLNLHRQIDLLNTHLKDLKELPDDEELMDEEMPLRWMTEGIP
jgi:hypothetical protein